MDSCGLKVFIHKHTGIQNYKFRPVGHFYGWSFLWLVIYSWSLVLDGVRRCWSNVTCWSNTAVGQNWIGHTFVGHLFLIVHKLVGPKPVGHSIVGTSVGEPIF
jgi:hypothetical protein